MKLPRLFFIIAVLISSAIAQTAGVTKSVAPATLNQITGDLVFPAGKTLTVNGTVSGTPAGGTLDLSAVTLTPPSNVVTLTGSQTLTNKTLTSPTLITPNIGAATGTSVNLSGTGTFGGNLTVSGKIIGGNSSDSGAISTLRSSGAATGLANVKASSALTVVDNTTANTDSAMVFGVNGSGAYIQGLYTTVASTITLQPYGGSTTLGGNLTVSGNGLNTFGGTGATNASILFGANNVANASAGYLSISQRLNYGFALFGYNMTGTSGSDAYTSPKNATGSAGVELIGGSLGITRFIYSTAATTAGNALTVTEAARFSNGNLLLKSDGIDSGNGKLQLANHTTSAGGIGFGTDTALFRLAAGHLSVDSTGNNPSLKLSISGTAYGWMEYYSPDNAVYLNSGTGKSLVLRTNGGTTALTLDASQNATFAGTISQTQAAAGSTANLKLNESGIREWGFYATGGKMSIRPSSAGTWSFNGNTDVELLRTTASTSTTTGALVVSGGVGVAGAVNAGGNVTAADVLLGGTSGPSAKSSIAARAPRGGIAYDGSTARTTSTLTGQNIGTDPFSISLIMKVNALTASAQDTFFQIGSSGTSIAPNSSIRGYVDSSKLYVELVNSSGVSRIASISTFWSRFAGKTVHVVITRNGATLQVYINGVLETITEYGSASWADSITSTFLNVGPVASSYTLNGEFYSASLYNLALSASDVVEIYESSGAVPFRYQFGSQTARYTSDFSVGTDSWTVTGGAGAALTGNVDSIGAENDWQRISMVSGTGQLGMYRGSPINSAIGKRFRIKGRLRHDSASIVSVNIQENNNTPNGFYVSVAQNTTVDFDSVWNNTIGSNSPLIVIISNQGAGTGESLYIKNLQAIQLGAIVHLTLDDGVGYQLHDASTNALDAIMTTTGVSHIMAKREGYVRGTLTWSGSHEGKSLVGQAVLPYEAILTTVATKATASSSGSGLTIGTTNSATRFVALNTYSINNKKVHSIATATPSGTTVNDLDIIIDPDTANYTGSIQAMIRYTVMEGAP